MKEEYGLFSPEIKDDPEAQAKVREWIEVLRTGKYQQGKGFLRTPGGRYCCLGVACDLIDPDGWDLVSVSDIASDVDRDDLSQDIGDEAKVWEWGNEAGEANTRVLPIGAQRALRLTHETGVLGQIFNLQGHGKLGYVGTLDGMNDSGVSFQEIAEVIEQELAEALN